MVYSIIKIQSLNTLSHLGVKRTGEAWDSLTEVGDRNCSLEKHASFAPSFNLCLPLTAVKSWPLPHTLTTGVCCLTSGSKMTLGWNLNSKEIFFSLQFFLSYILRSEHLIQPVTFDVFQKYKFWGTVFHNDNKLIAKKMINVLIIPQVSDPLLPPPQAFPFLSKLGQVIVLNH